MNDAHSAKKVNEYKLKNILDELNEAKTEAEEASNHSLDLEIKITKL